MCESGSHAVSGSGQALDANRNRNARSSRSREARHEVLPGDQDHLALDRVYRSEEQVRSLVRRSALRFSSASRHELASRFARIFPKIRGRPHRAVFILYRVISIIDK